MLWIVYVSERNAPNKRLARIRNNHDMFTHPNFVFFLWLLVVYAYLQIQISVLLFDFWGLKTSRTCLKTKAKQTSLFLTCASSFLTVGISERNCEDSMVRRFCLLWSYSDFPIDSNIWHFFRIWNKNNIKQSICPGKVLHLLYIETYLHKIARIYSWYHWNRRKDLND